MVGGDDHGLRFVNNVVAHNGGGAGLAVRGARIDAASLHHNLWFDNTGGPVDASFAFDPTADDNLAADPTFCTLSLDDDASNDDLRLRPESPALDRGDPTLLDADGSPSDLGATGGPDGLDLGDGACGADAEDTGAPTDDTGSPDDGADGADGGGGGGGGDGSCQSAPPAAGLMALLVAGLLAVGRRRSSRPSAAR